MSIFQDPTKSIPRGDSRVSRIPLDKSDIGARKSHIRNADKKNDFPIEHVKSK